MSNKDIKRSLTEIQRELGLRIQTFRKKKAMTQEYVASETGLHRSHVSAIECGRENVTLLSLLVIADVLKTSVAHLLNGIA